MPCLLLNSCEHLDLLVMTEHLAVDPGYVPDQGRVQGLRDNKALIQDPLFDRSRYMYVLYMVGLTCGVTEADTASCYSILSIFSTYPVEELPNLF